MKRREFIRILTGAGIAIAAPSPAVLAVAGARAQVGGMPHPLIPLFPLGVVLLPGNNLPLHIFEPRYREMIQECIDGSLEFGVLRVAGDTIAPVGCTARITDVIHRYRDGRFDILTRGQQRFRIVAPGASPGQAKPASLTEADFNSERAFFRGAPSFIDDDPARPSAGSVNESTEKDELIAQALDLRGKLMTLIAEDDPKSKLPQEKLPAASHPQLSFHLMDGLPAEADWKQELLELRAERERLVRVVLHLQHLIDLMESDSDQPSPRRIA